MNGRTAKLINKVVGQPMINPNGTRRFKKRPWQSKGGNELKRIWRRLNNKDKAVFRFALKTELKEG